MSTPEYRHPSANAPPRPSPEGGVFAPAQLSLPPPPVPVLAAPAYLPPGRFMLRPRVLPLPKSTPPPPVVVSPLLASPLLASTYEGALTLVAWPQAQAGASLAGACRSTDALMMMCTPRETLQSLLALQRLIDRWLEQCPLDESDRAHRLGNNDVIRGSVVAVPVPNALPGDPFTVQLRRIDAHIGAWLLLDDGALVGVDNVCEQPLFDMDTLTSVAAVWEASARRSSHGKPPILTLEVVTRVRRCMFAEALLKLPDGQVAAMLRVAFSGGSRDDFDALLPVLEELTRETTAAVMDALRDFTPAEEAVTSDCWIMHCLSRDTDSLCL